MKIQLQIQRTQQMQENKYTIHSHVNQHLVMGDATQTMLFDGVVACDPTAETNDDFTEDFIITIERDFI